MIKRIREWLNTPRMREIWEKDPIREDCPDDAAMRIFWAEQPVATKPVPSKYWFMNPPTELKQQTIFGYTVDSEACELTVLCVGLTAMMCSFTWIR